MEDGPPIFKQDFPCPVVLGIPLGVFRISRTGLSPSVTCLSRHFRYPSDYHIKVPQPLSSSLRIQKGLDCSLFARRYWGNRCCFLFLWLLRCFTLPRSLSDPMHSGQSTLAGGLPHSEIPRSQLGYQLPWAYRRFQRLSSPLDAKTSIHAPIVTGKQIGRASCRERVYVLV